MSLSWPCEVNRAVLDRRYDAVVSIGQVVPHEVIGMANYTKISWSALAGAEA
jgi:nickel-dependent lactate racemase